jgi:hypothetical protein
MRPPTLGAVALLSFCSASYAQVIECAPDLFKDLHTEDLDYSKKVNFLKIVDRENYNVAKQVFGADAVVPIEGVPVSFGGNYEEFDDQRERLFELLNTSTDLRSSKAVVQNAFSPLSTSAYKACLDANTQAGVYVRPNLVRPTGGNLVVRYVHPSGGDDIELKIEKMINDDPSTLEVEYVTLGPGDGDTITFTKQARNNLSIVSRGGGYIIPPFYFPADTASQFEPLGSGNCRTPDGEAGYSKLFRGEDLNQLDCMNICLDYGGCVGIEVGTDINDNWKCEVHTVTLGDPLPNDRANLQCFSRIR